MKISSASKKVLASALSAAMVVAFAPTVAFGAEQGAKLTVNYDLAGGTDTNTDEQGKLTLSQKLTVDNSQKITLANYNKIVKVSGKNAVGDPTGYAITGWMLGYDANGDGDFNDDDDVALDSDGDGSNGQTAYGLTGVTANVAGYKISEAIPLSAIAQYGTAKLAGSFSIDNNGDETHPYATVTLSNTSHDGGTILASGGAYVVVTDADGNAVTKAVKNEPVVMAAKAGTYTAELFDGNGVSLNKKTFNVGAVELTGGVFTDPFNPARKVTSVTAYYEASLTAGTTYDSILAIGAGLASSFTAVTEKGDGADYAVFYNDKGQTVLTSVANGYTLGGVASTEKGAITTVLTATYASKGGSITSFKADEYDLKIATVNVGAAVATSANPKDIAAAPTATVKYYLVITDESGKIVAESVDTNDDGKTGLTWNGAAATVSNVSAGTYTATLYKVTGPKTGGLDDASAGFVEVADTATVAVAGVAAPGWSYAADTTGSTTVAGNLTMTNEAGADYAVYYNWNSAVVFNSTTGAVTTGAKYDTAKGALQIAKTHANDVLYMKTVYIGTDKKVTPKVSADVILKGCGDATAGAFKTVADYAKAAGNVKINNKATAYYGNDTDFKAAVDAAKKALTDKGFKAQVVKGGTDVTWNEDVIAAEQAIVNAAGAVAKEEVEKLFAGVVDSKTGDLTKISSDNREKAIAAIEKVSADYTVNHDADKTNNVAKNGEITYSDADASYIEAVDAALQTAAKATVTYKKADVDAAAAVTAQLKDPKTAAAGLEAYAALSSAAKELVAPADVAAAQEAVAAAALVKAQDKAAAATGKAQVKGTTYKIKAKGSKTIKIAKSASGAKVTLKQVSGTKYAKVSGTKVTLKKAAKKGKKYTIKVKAVCGATTTSTVSFKVLVK